MNKVDLKKIKYLRKKSGISLDEMARRLGYESQNGYYYLETGRNKFSAEHLMMTACILDVDINQLFFVEKVTGLATI